MNLFYILCAKNEKFKRKNLNLFIFLIKKYNDMLNINHKKHKKNLFKKYDKHTKLR